MELLTFTRMNDNEYRATIPGHILKIAQKESVSIPMEDSNVVINISIAQWLTYNAEPSKGIWGSISNEQFDVNSAYIVYYKPKNNPPLLMAEKIPN